MAFNDTTFWIPLSVMSAAEFQFVWTGVLTEVVMMKTFILWYTTLCSQNSTDISEKHVDTSSASKIKPSKKETIVRQIARRTCLTLVSSFHYSSVLMMKLSHSSKLSVDYQRIFLHNAVHYQWIFLQNVRWLSTEYTAPYTRRYKSSSF
jgi:hypothetical protein